MYHKVYGVKFLFLFKWHYLTPQNCLLGSFDRDEYVGEVGILVTKHNSCHFGDFWNSTTHEYACC